MTDKLWRHVTAKISVEPSGCWFWTGSRFSNGYGYFQVQSKPRKAALAHRWLYERIVGPIPDGMDLDHLCRVRHCVNPAHLEPVSRSENLRRSPGLMGQAQRKKTHCPRGHPYDETNTYLHLGRRHCRACRDEETRNRRAAMKDDPEALRTYREADAARAREYRTRLRGGTPAQPNAEKTHCKNGHPLSGDNLWVDGSGARRCRQCRREASTRAYRKRRTTGDHAR